MFVLHQYINSEHRLTPSDSLSMVYEDLLQRQRSLITWEWSGVRFPASPIANVKCIHISHFFCIFLRWIDCAAKRPENQVAVRN